jgi:alpha-glucosidase (family GH31 glycosyl hydrolase)
MEYQTNPIIFENARFTIIAPELIRIEYSIDNSFVDDKTLFAENRVCSNDPYKVRKNNKQIIIETGSIKLVYSPDGKPISKKNIYALLKISKKIIKWYPGLKNYFNLGGTLRTLDQARGKMPLGEGVLSRDGWYLLDDSNEPIIHEDWIQERPAGHIIDWYLFSYGTNYKLGLKLLTKISGNIPLPPRYSLGSWYSRYWPYSSDEYRKIVDEYKDNDFPLDIMVLDMDWHKDGWTGWSWNRKLLPDAEKLLKDLHKKKLSVTLNIHPADGVLPHEDMYNDFMKDMGFMIDDDTETKPTLPFDASNKEYMTKLFKHTHEPREKEGVDFWWLDWQQFDKTVGMKSLRNLPWLNRYYFRHLSNNNRRGISFSRWGGWGDQKNPIHFSGDSVSIWPMLEFEIPFTSIAGNVGCFFWSHDIGGHFGGLNPETNVRWIQFGAMSAALRLHSTRDKNMDKRPWLSDEVFTKSMQLAFHLRSILFPYIYSSVWHSCKESVPFIKPMYIEYPDNENAYINPQQYLFGDALLVAPITSEGLGRDYISSQRVWFPKGIWFNYFNNEKIESKDQYDIVWNDINSFPLFVKGGTPITLRPYTQRMATEKLDTLIIRVYPGEDKTKNETYFYDDDGQSQDYISGKYSRTKIAYTKNKDMNEISIFPTEGEFKNNLSSRKYIVEFAGLQKTGFCEVNNKIIPIEYDTDNNICRVKLDKKPLNQKIVIKIKSNEIDNNTVREKYKLMLFDSIMNKGIDPDLYKAVLNLNNEFSVSAKYEKLKSFFSGLMMQKIDINEIYITKAKDSKADNQIKISIIDFFGKKSSHGKEKIFNLDTGSSRVFKIQKPLEKDFGRTSKRIIKLSSSIDGKNIVQYCPLEEIGSYLLNWQLLGPFTYDPSKKITEHVYGPEKENNINLKKSYVGKNSEKINWFKYEHHNIYNVVDLRKQINLDTAIAFGYTKIISPKEQDILFEINSDDGCEIWLNYEKIHSMDVIRTIVHEPEKIMAKLKMGENIVLAKVTQAEGSWELKIKIETDYPVKS